MVAIKYEIAIDASPEVVRSTFFDFESHAQWDPFLILIVPRDEDVKPGTVLEIDLQFQGAAPRKMKPTVLKNTPEELRWRGLLWYESIFCAQHYFQFKPTTDGKTTLVQGEDLSGFLVPVISWFGLFERSKIGIQLLNAALKDEVESRA